jgi:hypothetical protein
MWHYSEGMDPSDELFLGSTNFSGVWSRLMLLISAVG